MKKLRERKDNNNKQGSNKGGREKWEGESEKKRTRESWRKRRK